VQCISLNLRFPECTQTWFLLSIFIMGILDYIHTRNATLGAVPAPVAIHTSMCRSEPTTLALRDNALSASGVSSSRPSLLGLGPVRLAAPSDKKDLAVRYANGG
jgi:hypothetical protein